MTLLGKLAFSTDKKSNYKYYVTINPWLQVKLLRMLQYFPPPSDKNVAARLNKVLSEILTKTVFTKNPNKNNADHSILFEAVNVIIHLAINGEDSYFVAALAFTRNVLVPPRPV